MAELDQEQFIRCPACGCRKMRKNMAAHLCQVKVCRTCKSLDLSGSEKDGYTCNNCNGEGVLWMSPKDRLEMGA